MKGKKRQIQEILESFHLPGNRGRADSGWTKISNQSMQGDLLLTSTPSDCFAVGFNL